MRKQCIHILISSPKVKEEQCIHLTTSSPYRNIRRIFNSQPKSKITNNVDKCRISKKKKDKKKNPIVKEYFIQVGLYIHFAKTGYPALPPWLPGRRERSTLFSLLPIRESIERGNSAECGYHLRHVPSN